MVHLCAECSYLFNHVPISIHFCTALGTIEPFSRADQAQAASGQEEEEEVDRSVKSDLQFAIPQRGFTRDKYNSEIPAKQEPLWCWPKHQSEAT